MTISMVTVLATGERFVGRGIRSIEPVLYELVSAARDELHIASYRFDEAALPFLGLIEGALQRGVRGVIVTSHIGSQPPAVQHMLQRIAKAYRYARVVDFLSTCGGLLHAKVVVADRSRAVIGSANLTSGGLTGNHEIAVLVEGEAAWQVASLVDRLADRQNVVADNPGTRGT